MTTKTFHDIYDLVSLVEELENASIEIATHDGELYFNVQNYDKDAAGNYSKADCIEIDGTRVQIRGYIENVDKACCMVEKKIASGAWKKVTA